MPECTTPLLCELWCSATAAPFSITATESRGRASSRESAVANPTMPPPTMATSYSVRFKVLQDTAADEGGGPYRPLLHRDGDASPGCGPVGWSGRFRLFAVAAAHDVLAHALAGGPVALLHLRLHPQCGHGAGAAVLIQRHEVEVADGAEPAVTGERVLAVDLAAHDHAAATRPGHAALEFDDLAHVDGVAEVDGFRGGSYHHGAAEALRGDGGAHVHQGEDLAAEQRAEGVGHVREGGLHAGDPIGHYGFIGGVGHEAIIC